MYLKVQDGKDAATYHCRQVEIAPPDGARVSVQLFGVVSAMRERTNGAGRMTMESQTLAAETLTVRLPEDGQAIYCMDDRRRTTKIIRYTPKEATS